MDAYKVFVLDYFNILILHSASWLLYMYTKTHRERAVEELNMLSSKMTKKKKDDKYADIKDSENKDRQSQYYQLGMERKTVPIPGQWKCSWYNFANTYPFVSNGFICFPSSFHLLSPLPNSPETFNYLGSFRKLKEQLNPAIHPTHIYSHSYSLNSTIKEWW